MAFLSVIHPLRVSLPQCSSRQLYRSLARSSSARPLVLRAGACRSFSNYLVSPQELADALKTSPPSPISSEPRVIPLCASWFMPNDPQGRTGIDVFREKRIPKARFFDLDKVIDKRSPYPHMLPNSKHFAESMSELGIRREDTVVVYDSWELGIFSAPRVGWTMKVFGHPKVHILNNFRLWVDQGLPTESGNVWTVECGMYPIPELDENKVADFDAVREVALDYNKEGAEGVQVLDARSHGRWAGTVPEPRAGLSSGHMPGSINIPFDAVLDPETKAFLPTEKLKELFTKSGVDPTKPIISTCGTGVTACIIETALNEAGVGSPETRKVYDGSWTEWAQRVKPSDSLIRKEGDVV
ncbi:Rhodanese-like domain-containing protein [Bombardia bombarda]|uniref:Rhodanese-like domain-containing protein n=1 Tax=Bombardia bombarda TaxID=252184 RepID=A0AA39TGT9_9PEZI|nr:Rhodanese-like domain-containing protein [Bombardia bombarda]